MHDQSRAKIRRLSIWVAINLVIFGACYLNYRLQLKHRYLYRILSVGLCLSRAAAMVINFNLILVWIPMCKYTLTKLAVLACDTNSSLRARLDHLISAAPSYSTGASQIIEQPSDGCHHYIAGKQAPGNKSQGAKSAPVSISSQLAKKLSLTVCRINWKIKCQLCRLKMNTINSFLVAVDHATSLHTICATTITLASVIHTIAHLMNVINFSNNYDPLLDNLNMAAHRGQNPLQLLVSVPGITGCLMIIILFLMSLSSISTIRNSSFDLFQIFHRLSVLFVILLILHPSSHVLKEQVNVDRHNPDVCYDEMIRSRDEILVTRAENSSVGFARRADELTSAPHLLRVQSNATTNKLDSLEFGANNLHDILQRISSSRANNQHSSLHADQRSTRNVVDQKREHLSNNATGVNTNDSNQPESQQDSRLQVNFNTEDTNPSYFDPDETSLYSHAKGEEPCLDLHPRFVPQSSLCWYVLAVGLSCYILDLLLRRLRRSRSPIELLDARSDGEGNLMELVLSNNHKRFAHWMPGQFVYLNCPQLATYEWHPFTISSMDNRTRQFTLHIKAGGDWTRKLRDELELRQSQYDVQMHEKQAVEDSRPHEKQNSMSLFSRVHKWSSNRSMSGLNGAHRGGSKIGFGQASHFGSLTPFARRYNSVNVVANLDCYDQRTGQSQVECRKLVCLARGDNRQTGKQQRQLSADCMRTTRDCVRIDLDDVQQDSRPYSICSLSLDHSHLNQPAAVRRQKPATIARTCTEPQAKHANLDLFIDGPFHSPFERLLEQQVSVCIANGVGWTAFSSVFQQIISDQIKETEKDAWWAQWRNYVQPKKGSTRLEAHDADKYKEGQAAANKTNDDATALSNTPQTTTVDIKRKLSLDTKLHIMIIVTTIEQLRPFYNIAMKYFDHQRSPEAGANIATRYNPIQDITAFITRSTKSDPGVIEFCRQERLNLVDNGDADDTLIVNDKFLIRLGKPNFDSYLCNFSNLYKNKRKISIYCCGSWQVKRTVEEICRNLNKQSRSDRHDNNAGLKPPSYFYHEENF